MPEEKPAIENQILAWLSRLDEKVEARFERLESRLEAFHTQVNSTE